MLDLSKTDFLLARLNLLRPKISLEGTFWCTLLHPGSVTVIGSLFFILFGYLFLEFPWRGMGGRKWVLLPSGTYILGPSSPNNARIYLSVTQ